MLLRWLYFFFCMARTSTAVWPWTSCQKKLMLNQTFGVQKSAKDGVISVSPHFFMFVFHIFLRAKAALKRLAVMCPQGSGVMLFPCASRQLCLKNGK